MITVPERAGDFNWSDAATADLKQVIGATGIADTEFLPHGTVRIGDRLFEAVSESGPIDPGQSVRVTRLDVGRLVVVPLRSRPGDAATMSEGSGLDRPISELDLDSLE